MKEKEQRMAGIAEYGLIGNCRSAALISRQGAIDWCCLPEFHSPSIFSALLDRDRGGYFSIAPASQYTSSQAYIADTNVLETRFTCGIGEVVITDAFTVDTEEAKKGSLFPDHEILRMVKCTSGTVTLELKFVPRLYYGRESAPLKRSTTGDVLFQWKENSFHFMSTLPAEAVTLNNNQVSSCFQMQEGATLFFSLSCSTQSPAILPELKITAELRMQRTIQYWKNWISRCRYDGVYATWVKRSALALKLMAHAPSGAIVAAPTTSLPEEAGGKRNWDYRYCWLRDASFTMRALVALGFEDETHAYMDWILHATQLTRPKLQVVYSVFGEAKLQEQQLDWLAGFEASRPVRTGNEAYHQHQLDVYGEVLDAFYSYASLVNSFDRMSIAFMKGLGDVICTYWDQPDHGIWEKRSVPSHHTHSKVMAWVGLDRLIRLAEKYGWKNLPVQKYSDTAELIRQKI